MKWFYNLKISTKLLGGFISVALIAAVVGGVGFIEIGKMDDNSTRLYERVTVPTSELADMSTAFQRVRLNLYQAVLSDNPQEKALCLETILGTNRPALKPWGLLRVSVLVLLTACGTSSVWQEAHTRRTNVDLIASVLNEQAKEGDFIVVQFAFEGITFDRYYHGKARWTTIPPIDSHKVHRSDLIWEKMNQRDAMAPVLASAMTALKSGGSVWVVGRVELVHSSELPAAPLPAQSLLCLGQFARR